ncbi:MAG TPA: class I SAM-dependent methyltransferase [Bacilli bacterium]
MSHYFINDPNLKSDPRTFAFNYRNKKITFLSDAGVFSKNRVDFGTALLLNSLPEDLNNKKILDVGCGYGAIGLSVAKVYPLAHIEMTDVNLRALELAKRNALENGLKNVTIFASNLYENVASRFDLIISNPPIRAGKDIVHGIVEGAKEHLNPEGELWVVIQKKQGAPSLLRKLETLFPDTIVFTKDKGYYIIRSRKL